MTDEQRKIMGQYLKDSGAKAGASAAPADAELSRACEKACEHTAKFPPPPGAGIGVGSMYGIDEKKVGAEATKKGCVDDCTRV